MRSRFVFLASLSAAVGLIALACAPAAPAPAPTKAPAASTAAPAAPTKAPAAPAPTKASEPTKAPEPTKPAAQPTAVPAPKVTYPEKGKTITVISPWAAGGSADIGVRLIASALEQDLGVAVQVVNKAGAGGQVGITELVKAKADGYTIATANIPATMTTYLDKSRQAVYGRKDLQMVALYDTDPSIMGVRADSPFKTVKDVFDAAKAKPEGIRASSSGPWTSQHINVLLWEKAAGVKFAIVQFDGSGPGLTAMLGGHIELFAGTAGGIIPAYRSGQARILGVLDRQKSKLMPDVETLESMGYRIYGSSSRGVTVPSGTPKEVVDVLSAAIKRATDKPDFQKKMEDAGLTMRFLGPSEFSAMWDQMESDVKTLMEELAKTQK